MPICNDKKSDHNDDQPVSTSVDSTSADSTTVDMARLRWQCRRGMKELEVLIQPFFEQHFLHLDNVQKDDFAELLKASDVELYAWFLGYEQPDSDRLAALIDMIQSAAYSKV